MPRVAAEERSVRAPSTFRFRLDLHPAQQEIFESKARFKVVAAGRRFGKTMLAGIMCLVVAMSVPDAVVMWVSPSHRQSKKAMRWMLRWLRQIPRELWDANRTDQEIFILGNGSIIQFVSAERFDNLRGDGLTFVVLDEAAKIPQEAWNDVLRPTLADTGGSAMFIGTFKGENWFYDLWRRAMDPASSPEWEGWKLPTSENPYIPESEIEQMRRDMTHEEFEQEIMCSPITYQGAVFPGERLNAAWDAGQHFEIQMVQIGDEGRPVLLQPEAGLDWGWNVTAFEVCAELPNGQIVWLDEDVFKRVELNEKCHAIAELCLKHRIACIYADAAGADENVTLAKILEELGAPTVVQPVPFNAYKRAGILARSYYLERGMEVITPLCSQLKADSMAYHYDKDRSGSQLNDLKPAKGNDHTVDAATAFYASRASDLGEALFADREEAA